MHVSGTCFESFFYILIDKEFVSVRVMHKGVPSDIFAIGMSEPVSWLKNLDRGVAMRTRRGFPLRKKTKTRDIIAIERTPSVFDYLAIKGRVVLGSKLNMLFHRVTADSPTSC